jgi:hypothetical protein
MLDSRLYIDAYNALPDVLDADRWLERQGRSDILDPLCAIILKHGLERVYGIRLLHSHHPVYAGEAMVEDEELLTDADALTTRAVAIAQCGTRVAANSWRLVDGDWLPVEYSADALVLETDPIERHPAFTAEFAIALEAVGATGKLGLCAARRRFYDRYAGDAYARGHALLETTDPTRRANVLRFADVSGYSPENLIQTVWLAMAEDDDGGNKCIALCGIHCAILVLCGEDNSGGHTKEIGHDTSHTTSH